MFADTGTIKVLNKLAEQMSQMVKLQEQIVDSVTAIKNKMTGETYEDKYRRNEVCGHDCSPYGH